MGEEFGEVFFISKTAPLLSLLFLTRYSIPISDIKNTVYVALSNCQSTLVKLSRRNTISEIGGACSSLQIIFFVTGIFLMYIRVK